MKITKEWMEKHNPDIADIDKCQFVIDCKIERTKEILLLLKAFDLTDAIEKIETTYRDDLNTKNTDKEKEVKE